VRLLVAIVLALIIVSCGGPPPEEPSPTSNLADNRCAQLSQEVVDAYNRGDTEAEKAAGDEFDRLAEAGQCD
jgi:hypothetical protein